MSVKVRLAAMGLYEDTAAQLRAALAFLKSELRKRLFLRAVFAVVHVALPGDALLKSLLLKPNFLH